MTLSVIVPIYQEEKNIPVFLSSLQPILECITKEYEIIFCLDPGIDKSQEVVLEARKKNSRIKLLKFSRRFGQPMAIIAGLQYSSGKAGVVMDVDMQDPPELVAKMVNLWQAGFDVVMAQRRKRTGETWVKKTVASFGYAVINKISEVPIPPNTGEFRLMSRRVIDEVLRLNESHGFLRGLVALVGFKQTTIVFDRPERRYGLGNYNRFLGSLRIGFHGVFCFSTYLLSLSTQVGFAIALISFILGLAYFIMKVFGFPFPLGNPTIVILVLFMGGVQLISVGILGEYIGRIYEEVRKRPKFIIEETFGFKK